MDDVFQILVLLATGFAGGILAGLLGIGGGVIYVVVLTYYLRQYDPSSEEVVKYIVSNSGFAIFFASLAGSYKQLRKKNYFFKEVLLTALPAMITVIVASLFIIRLDWYSKEKFTVFFIAVLVFFIYKVLIDKNQGGLDQIHKKHYLFVGALTGIFSAFSGLGGGAIMVPILSGVFKLKIKKVTSVSLGAMPFFMIAMTLVYAFQKESPLSQIPGSIGFIIPAFVIPVSCGVILGSPMGVNLSHKLPDKVIKTIFAVVLTLVIIRMIYSVL